MPTTLEPPATKPETPEIEEDFGFWKIEEKSKPRPIKERAWAWEQTVEKYREAIQTKPGLLEKIEKADTLNAWGHFELATSLFQALHQSAPPNTAFVINSSTGKDSTLATQAALAAVLEEIQSGRGWQRRIVVAIADTRSEFPEMSARMHLEAQALNALAEKWRIPLEARVIQPPVKNRLLVELCGNGKPLPAVNKKGKAEGVSSWCMDRVKAGTLNKIAREMTQDLGDYIAVLGTRSAESTRRKESIQKHSTGLPIGISRIAKGSAHWGLASTPITLFPNKMVSDFLRAFPSQWRPEGREELRTIYFKGSPLETDENYSPSECAVTISDEGQVSNSCSDLSGTRYGCWHCFLSENKSLKNTSRREPKYAWLRKFHGYIRIKAKASIKRSKTLKDLGFTRENSFTKTYSFLERYKLLMLLYRTEAESGLSLLLPEEEAEIERFWRKHGVVSVTPEDARKDAETWRQSGRWTAFFEGIEDECHRLCNALSEGIPFGALHGLARNTDTFQLEETKKSRTKPLELSHLLAIAGQGFGSPPYPKQLTYTYRQKNPDKPDTIICVVTDTPSLLGLPTNTGLLNGMSGIRWECLGIRLPTPEEKSAAQDRNFAYCISPELPHGGGPTASWSPTAKMEWAYQLLQTQHGCKSDDPWKDHWFDSQMIQSLRPVEKPVLAELLKLGFELAATSDYLTDYFSQKRAACIQAIAPYIEHLGEDSPRGRDAVSATRRTVSQILQIETARPTLETYAHLIKTAARAIRAGILNTSLLLKLCYIAQLEAVDPAGAEQSLAELLRVWPHNPIPQPTP